MPIRHALWTVTPEPAELRASTVPDERTLEAMIVAQPRILSEDWMLIGSQIQTPHGGRLDLLAIAPDGALVVIELKRERTPRDVVAQAIDYASWVATLDASAVASVFERFAGQRSAATRDLGQAFHERFGGPLDDDAINASHQIVIVAAELDAGTERIVAYLSERDIPINVLFFQVFEHEGVKLLSRAWLFDPVESQASAATAAPARARSEPWNGEFYVSFGHSASRSWDEACRHSFISAGGGTWYSNTLDLLAPSDRIWVKAPGYGFVGVARVAGRKVPLAEYEIDGRPAVEVLTAIYHREHINDPDRTEYFVPVEWLHTVPLEQSVQEAGMFGNQNTVCRPKTPAWRMTIERLKEHFPAYGE